jgi:hypothetical protein
MRADVEIEIQRILPLIPKQPPENSIEILKKRGFLKDERLLYNIEYGTNLNGERQKMVRVKCSLCGCSSLLEHVPAANCRHAYGTYGFINPIDNAPVTSGDTCVCPICGKGMRAIHKGSFKNCTEIDSRIYMSVHNIEGHLTLLGWVTKKMLHNDGRITYWTNGYEGVVLIEKSFVRIKMYSKFMSSYSWSSNWNYTKRFVDLFGEYSRQEIVDTSPLTVERTDCAHSALAEYLNSAGPLDPVHYMKLWLKHPNVENLVRQGLSRYLCAVIEKSNEYDYSHNSRTFNIKATERFINWSEEKPAKMLGLSKGELDIARNVSFDALEFYRVMKDRLGIRLDTAMIGRIEKYGYNSVRSMVLTPVYATSVPLVHLINYLDKQRDASDRPKLISAEYLQDYWRSCNRFYGKVPAELAYPKDLIRAHDDILARIKEKEDEELRVGFANRFADLSKMSYQSEATGLMIRPAETQKELIDEGKILHHCVAGYAKSHSEGKTSIFFIRRIAEPNVPFYTLEYKDGKVNQNRGNKNCDRTAEVIAFEKEWLEYIQNYKEFIKENGKRSSRNQERIRAGA